MGADFIRLRYGILLWIDFQLIDNYGIKLRLTEAFFPKQQICLMASNTIERFKGRSTSGLYLIFGRFICFVFLAEFR